MRQHVAVPLLPQEFVENMLVDTTSRPAAGFELIVEGQ